MILDEAQAELWVYTLGRGDAEFAHQHAADALAAQRADANTTAMQLTFALVALHLHVERGYTGRQIQQVHARLARRGTARGTAIDMMRRRSGSRHLAFLMGRAKPLRSPWLMMLSRRDACVQHWRLSQAR